MTMRSPFTSRPGDPVNPLAWLGAAPYIEAKVFPSAVGERLWASGWNDASLRDAISIARHCEDSSEYWQQAWRRVLLPMLLEEARKRGIKP